ncbi:MAG: PAS domain-containing sensor histidine kinase [Candidatus Omnitrophica bacterium]|nr:PAS domain-containing sensor histidine kinase [Candidatus Omnitrophota bacterium]
MREYKRLFLKIFFLIYFVLGVLITFYFYDKKLYGFSVIFSGLAFLSFGIYVSFIFRKLHEQQLFESEERFKQVTMVSQNWIWELDVDYKYKYSNDAVKNLLGRSPSDIVGKHFYDFFKNGAQDESAKAIMELFETGLPFRGKLTNRVTDENIEIFTKVAAVPVKNRQGKVIGFRGVDSDVTALKDAEAQLTKSRDYFFKIINTIGDPVFVKDRQHRWVLLNDAHDAFFGYPKEEILGKSDYDLFPKEQAVVFWEKDEKVFTTGIEDVNEEEITDSHGKVHTIFTKKCLYQDNEGNKFIVGVIRDITELTDAQKRLKEAMEIKTRFTSMVSHELRTPLAAIKTGVNLVYDGLAGNVTDEQKMFLGVVRRNLDRLSRLINDVLDFQKFEAGKMIFQMEKHKINDIINEVYHSLVSLINEKGLTLKLDLADDLPVIDVDHDKIIQVLNNFINNAIKFTDKGSITVKAYRKDDYVVTDVIDTGIGIKKEDLNKLFVAFEQIGREKNPQNKGTGLGLVISKEIINGHYGKIWVESKVGEGTIFSFALPIKRKV